MWSVLVVDDEYYARRGLERLVELIGGEYELIGAAENGNEALNIIREQRPNIVLVDIQMPEMDGLKLLQVAKDSGSRFIIVTGHNDVEYAKQALRYNTVDYLLKPINQEQLKKALDRTVEFLSEDINALRHRIVTYLRGQTSDIGAIERLNIKEYQLLLFELEVDGSRTELKQGAKMLRDWLLDWLTIPCAVVQMHTDRIVVLGDIADDWISRVSLLQTALKNHKITITTVIVKAQNVVSLPDAYETARQILLRRFYQGSGKIFTELPVPNRPAKVGELDHAVQILQHSIAAYNTREALNKLRELFQIIRDTQPTKELITEICMSFYLQLTAALREVRGLPDDFTDFNPVHHDHSLRSLWLNMEVMIRQGVGLLWEKQDEQEDNSVEKAIQIINARYCEELALNQIAQEVFLSPSYLSRKLKKILGMNFSKYITSLRMKKAQELLQRGASVEQAAKAVGYSNYRYFSEVFKQNVGCLPSHYP